MPHVITDFQAGLIKKLLERGKPIEREVLNAIVGWNLLDEDLRPEDAPEKLRALFPETLINRTVGVNNLTIKTEP